MDKKIWNQLGSKQSSEGLKDHFLVAMPNLKDPVFTNSVTYICEHTDQGAMGLVINKPLDISLGEIFKSMDIECIDDFVQRNVLSGGPVQDKRGFVLHKTGRCWSNTVTVSSDISLTASRDILDALAKGKGPSEALFILGYAGWGKGQLEEELTDNLWLCVPALAEVLFQTPFQDRASAAVSQLGIDLSLIAAEPGHA